MALNDCALHEDRVKSGIVEYLEAVYTKALKSRYRSCTQHVDSRKVYLVLVATVVGHPRYGEEDINWREDTQASTAVFHFVFHFCYTHTQTHTLFPLL